MKGGGMGIVFALVAILAGMTSALQSGANQALQKSLSAPVWTVVMVSVVTLASTVLLPVIAGERWPAGQAIAATPWWAWTGGIFGVIFVLGTVYATPRLGAGLFVALVVTASTVTSLLLDHFGWMGFEVHRAGVGRIAGALLMIAGVALVGAF